jgi:hypothetical protein
VGTNRSQIAPELESLLNRELDGGRLHVLWSGRDDGFEGSTFHAKCDNHKPTLTVIRDTAGNIFGGYAAAAWQSIPWNGAAGSPSNCHIGDPSNRSFLFSLHRSGTTGLMTFPIIADRNGCALFCDAPVGPSFGKGDLKVSKNCSTDGESYIEIGRAYDKRDVRDAFFRGTRRFQVAEIEVCEIVK